MLAALLNNMEDLTGAYEDALSADGSALKENAAYLDSLSGRIDIFKNAAQTMWMNFLDTDVLKFIVDVGTALIRIIDDVGALQSLLVSLGGVLVFKNRKTIFSAFDSLFNASSGGTQVNKMAEAITNVQNVMNSGKASIDAYANAVKGLSAAEQAQILAEQGLTQAQIDAVLAKNNATIASQEATIAKEQETAATVASAEADVAEATTSEVSAQADIQEAIASETSATADIAEAAASEAASAADLGEASASKAAAVGDVAEAAASGAAGMGSMAKGASKLSGIFGKLSSVGSKLGGVLSKLGVGGVAGIAIAGFTVISSVLRHYKQEQEDARQATIQAGQSLNQTASSIESYKSRIASLKASLASGNLSEQEAYDTKKELIAVQNEMVSSLGDEARSFDILRDSIEGCNNALDEMSQRQAETYLAENAEQISKATTEMEKVQNWMNGVGGLGWSDANPELTKKLESIVGKYDNAKIEYGVNGQTNATGGKWMTLNITADAEGAKETMVGLSKDFAQLEQEMGIDLNEALGMEGAQSWSLRFQKDIAKVNGVIDKWKEIYDNSTVWEIAGNDDYSAMLNDINDAKSQIEEAIASGSHTDLEDAFANFDDVKLKFQTMLDDPDVPQRVKDYIQEIVDGIESVSQSTKVELELETEFKNPDGKVKKDFENILNGLVDEAGKKLNMTEILSVGLDYENDMNKASVMQDAGDTQGFDAIMNGLTDQELAYGRLKSAADQYGVSVEDLLSILVKLGQVEPPATGELAFSFNLDAESTSIGNLTTALTESASAAGLSADSISNLKSRYSDLEGFNPASLFEETTHGIHLNAKALGELEQAYAKQQTGALEDQLGRLVEDYNSLTEQINSCSDASERASLYQQRDSVLAQINDTATLAAQYKGLTSAYNQWQNAQSAGNERDMYEGVLSGKEEIEDELSRGWLDDGTVKYLELLSGKDLSTAKYDELLSTYQALNKEIGAGYNVFDFFTKNEDGNATTDGIYNFFDTVMAKQKEIGKEWVKIGEDGSYTFDFGVNGDKAIAEALGISEELVQIILRAAQDAGFDINLDGAYSQLADLKDVAEEANNKLKELGATDYTFNVNSTDINDVNAQIEEAQITLNKFKNEDGTVNINAAGAKEAQQILGALIYQKKVLEAPTVLSLDTSGAGEEIQSIMSLLNELKANADTVEVKTAIGQDTGEAQTQLNATVSALQQSAPEVLAQLGIDSTSTAADINAAISTLTPETLQPILVKAGVNQDEVTTFLATNHDTDSDVIWHNVTEEVDTWRAQNHDIHADVIWGNNELNVKKTFTATGTINWSDGPKVNGTAHVRGTLPSKGSTYARGSWGAPRDETALVGELGQELLVRDGRWYTVGDNGAEFTNIKRGDIIFNHKQTKDLLSKGYVVGRGKAYAEGTAFSDGGGPGRTTVHNAYKHIYTSSNASDPTASAIKDNTSAVKENTKAVEKTSDDFSEMIDWIEVLFSRIESAIAEQEAIIENKLDSISAISDKTPNYNIIFEKYTQQLIASQKAAAKYQQLANEAMSGLSDDIIDKIKNGAIDVAEYKDEETVKKINEALDYQEKALEYTRKIEETTSEIAATAKKEFDDVQQAYENVIAQVEHLNDLYQSKNELSALKYGFGAESYLKEQVKGSLELLELLQRERRDLQAKLQSGKIPVNSQEWYDMVEAIHDVDDAIVDCETSLEDLQNEINDLHWEAFDELMNRFDYIGSDIENLVKLLSRQVNELVEEDLAKLTSSNWANKEGIATLGLYAQEMERAQYVANKYAEEIKELQANRDKYNEVEYTAKLNELISAQYESIEQYYEAKDAIIELNEARVDAIEEGIQEEIDAYSELIEKKKELLDEEQKLHEFNKTVTEQTKDIAKLRKQLAAMAGDDTAATVAKRKQLEAELLEAEEELEETYYDHSMDARQEALDKELADFEEEKNKEIEKWKDWLKDTEKVLNESFEYVQANTKVVYDTLTGLGEQYNLTLNDALVNPWMSGMSAIDNYSSVFSAAISSFTKELDKLATSWNNLLESIEKNASADVTQTDKNSNLYTPTSGKYTASDFAPGDITAAKVQKVQTGTTTSGEIKVGSQINAGNALIYGGYNDKTGDKQYFSSDPVYTVLEEKDGMLKVRWHGLSSGVTGYFKKSDVKAIGGTTVPTYSYVDSSGKTIEDYSTEYNNAKSSGNVQGMMAANNAANAIRKALGQQLQSAGQDIANVANSTGYTGPTNKGPSNVELYSTYKDQYGYTIDDYSKEYQACRARGDADGMQQANDRANDIRRKLGIAVQNASGDIAAVRAKYQYASGVNKVKEDQIALIDELGEELVVHTDGRGRLKYLEKGSGVVPADLTERLIDFATDPASVIDSMAPSIKAPRITSQNFNINMEFGELVHVDSVSKDTLPELQKMVRTEFNSLMREVNNGLRRAQKAK